MLNDLVYVLRFSGLDYVEYFTFVVRNLKEDRKALELNWQYKL